MSEHIRIEQHRVGSAMEAAALGKPPEPVTIAEIILDRAEKRNALTVAMLDGIITAAETIRRAGGIRGLVIRGEGRTFCSGFDVSLCRQDAGSLPALLRSLSLAVRTVRRLDIPVVIGVQAAAIAGAAALLGAADVVVAEQNAKIGYPVVNLGISPAVSAPSLAMMIDAGHARERLLDPALIDAAEAKRIGLVHVVVGLPEDVTPRAQIECTRLAIKPPAALRATRRWLNEIDGTMHDGVFEEALASSLSLTGNEEERSRLSAALEGRKQA